MSRRHPDDRGSLAIEYVMTAPLLLLVFALIFAFARVGQLDSQLDAGTRDAARAVTQLPDLSQAQSVAKRIVVDQLAGGESHCDASSVQVEVSAVRADGSSDPVPQPGATVTVSASCPYSLSDLGLPIPFPEQTARSELSSVVDPNRSAP